MTRHKLFWLLVSLRMLHAGYFTAFYYLLPEKWKQPKGYLFHSYLRPAILEIMKRSIFGTAQWSAEKYAQHGGRIGDTLTVRKPARFCR